MSCWLHPRNLNPGASSQPQLFVHLTPETFNVMRKKFGYSRYVGRSAPREVSKSWTYLQEGWNTCARSAVTAAIKTAINGDAETVGFAV